MVKNPKTENNNDKAVKRVEIHAFGGYGYGCRIGDLVIGRIYKSPETMPKEANTYLYVDDGQVRLANYKNGQRTSDIGIITLAVVLICKTKKEDMGCDFDCKNCPFPPCSKAGVERMKKVRNG